MVVKMRYFCIFIFTLIFGFSGAHNIPSAQSMKNEYFGHLQEASHPSQFHIPGYLDQTQHLKHQGQPKQSSSSDFLQKFNYRSQIQQLNHPSQFQQPAFQDKQLNQQEELRHLENLNEYQLRSFPGENQKLNYNDLPENLVPIIRRDSNAAYDKLSQIPRHIHQQDFPDQSGKNGHLIPPEKTGSSYQLQQLSNPALLHQFNQPNQHWRRGSGQEQYISDPAYFWQLNQPINLGQPMDSKEPVKHGYSKEDQQLKHSDMPDNGSPSAGSAYSLTHSKPSQFLSQSEQQHQHRDPRLNLEHLNANEEHDHSDNTQQLSNLDVHRQQNQQSEFVPPQHLSESQQGNYVKEDQQLKHLESNSGYNQPSQVSSHLQKDESVEPDKSSPENSDYERHHEQSNNPGLFPQLNHPDELGHSLHSRRHEYLNNPNLFRQLNHPEVLGQSMHSSHVQPEPISSHFPELNQSNSFKQSEYSSDPQFRDVQLPNHKDIGVPLVGLENNPIHSELSQMSNHPEQEVYPEQIVKRSDLSQTEIPGYSNQLQQQNKPDNSQQLNQSNISEQSKFLSHPHQPINFTTQQQLNMSGQPQQGSSSNSFSQLNHHEIPQFQNNSRQAEYLGNLNETNISKNQQHYDLGHLQQRDHSGQVNQSANSNIALNEYQLKNHSDSSSDNISASKLENSEARILQQSHPDNQRLLRPQRQLDNLDYSQGNSNLLGQLQHRSYPNPQIPPLNDLSRFGQSFGDLSHRSYLDEKKHDDPIMTREICDLKRNHGPCHAVFLRYYYNSDTGSCDKFIYGGCVGNANNFLTKEECTSICMHGKHSEAYNQGLLASAVDEGVETSSAVDHGVETSSAVEQGVETSSAVHEGADTSSVLDSGIDTSSELQHGIKILCPLYHGIKTSSLLHGIDSLSPLAHGMHVSSTLLKGLHGLSGLNHRLLPSPFEFHHGLLHSPFEFHPGLHSPFAFHHGLYTPFEFKHGLHFPFDFQHGLLSPHEIHHELHSPIEFHNGMSSDICHLKRSHGACHGVISRYYYDSDTHTCEKFKYGGCLGNANNFLTKEECSSVCLHKSYEIPSHEYWTDDHLKPWHYEHPVLPLWHPGPGLVHEVCSLKKRHGLCHAVFPRYYFNPATGSCEKFIYGGCYGNANNFFSKEECHFVCKGF